MKVLLDTHAVIWFFNGDKRLSETARQIILDAKNQKYVSVASLWEVVIKISLQKLQFNGGVNGFAALIDDNGFGLLPIAKKHILPLESLDFEHRDPFDRLLIATAIAENMQILTHDSNIRRYTVKHIW